MAIVEILSPDLKARLELARLLSSLGHQALHASDLQDFTELQARTPPEVLVVLENESAPWVPEVRRAAPLLPVVVCLSARSAVRALDYLKLGVSECVSPPLTREAVGASVRKALRLRGTVLELAELPPEPRPPRLWPLAAGVVFIVAAAVMAAFHSLKPAPVEPARTFELPYVHPAGLAAGPDAFWIGDWYAQSLYEHDAATLAIRRVRSFPQEAPAALAVAEGALWVATADGRVVKHALDPKLTALARLRVPGKSVVGLCFDGLYLWSADRGSRKLRQHLMDDRLSTAQEFTYPGVSPAAIACDKRGFWSIDDGTGQLLRHSLADPSEIEDKAPLSAYDVKRWRPSGLAVSGGRLWSVAEFAPGGKAVLVRHSQGESLQK